MKPSLGLTLILYARSYCHLCDDMRAALEPLRARFSFEVETVDVDADAALLALYDELVPLLAGPAADGGTVELCRYFLDSARVTTFLAAHTNPPAALPNPVPP